MSRRTYDHHVETFTSLAAAAYAAKTWYSDLESKTPPWDYEIQTFEDLLEAIEEHKKRIAAASGHYRYAAPRLAAVGIEKVWCCSAKFTIMAETAEEFLHFDSVSHVSIENFKRSEAQVDPKVDMYHLSLFPQR